MIWEPGHDPPSPHPHRRPALALRPRTRGRDAVRLRGEGMAEMIYKDLNYSLRPLDIAKDGDVFDGGNFTQHDEATVLTDAKNLTFRHCNMKNVLIDPSWIIEDCNTVQETIIDPDPDQIALEQAKADAKQQALDDYAAQLDDELAGAETVDDIDVSTIQADIAAKVMAQPSSVKRMGG
jgi:hypothetical protein